MCQDTFFFQYNGWGKKCKGFVWRRCFLAEKQGFLGAESFPQREIMVYWIQSHQMGGTVMKWGILATGTIAKKFASTVEQMGAEGEQLVAVGSRHLESAQAFAQQYGIPAAMTPTKPLLPTRRWRLSTLPLPTPCITKTASSAWSRASTFCAKNPLPSPRNRRSSCTVWRRKSTSFSWRRSGSGCCRCTTACARSLRRAPSGN